MTHLLAIISKSQFEDTHAEARVGDALAYERYVSTHAALRPLSDGGSLFLVTVRPPDERLWLVGELVDPKHDGEAWKSTASTLAVRDVTALMPQLRFVNGKGLTAKKGALGMSLQTPRQLTEADAQLLRGKPASTKAPAKPSKGGPDASALSLDAVLAAWRLTRAPELEVLIDTLSRHHARTWPALDVDADDFDTQWNARAAMLCAENLSTLLSGLWSKPLGSIPIRLRKLLDHGADPRLGEALLTMIDDPPFTASSNFPAWTQLFKALPTMVDTRATKRLEARKRKKGGESQFWPKFAGWIARAIDEFPEPATLTKPEAAGVAAQQKQAEKLLAGPPPTAVAPMTREVRPAPLAGTTEALEVALAHAEAGRFSEVLEPLRQAWEHTRAPQLAALITAFAKAGSSGRELSEAVKPDDFHERWLAAAKTFDATLVTPLLATLLKGTLVLTEHRLEAMLRWPPDPRVAECVLDRLIFGRAPYIGARPHLWSRAYDLLVAHADPRFVDRVRKNAERLDTAVAFDRNRAERPHALRTLEPYLKRAGAAVALLPNEQHLASRLEQLAAQAGAATKANQNPDQALGLLQAINAAPDAPEPRLVYADFLAERGDPRAEFINLSVALARGQKVKGPLEACARKLGIHKTLSAYHLGLLVKATVDENVVVPEAELDAFAEDLTWATVRELTLKFHFDAPDGAASTRLIEKGPLYAVRTLGIGSALLARASRRDFPWEVTRIDLADFRAPVDLRADAFPKLDTMGLSLWAPMEAAFFENPLLGHVRWLHMGSLQTMGLMPIDLLLVHGVKLPKLERISAVSAAFDFDVHVSGGRADVAFSVKSHAGPTDGFFTSTLKRLERVPATVVRSVRVEGLAGVRPESLAMAKQAAAHLH